MATNSSAPSTGGQGLAPSLPRAGHVSQLKNNWRVFEVRYELSTTLFCTPFKLFGC